MREIQQNKDIEDSKISKNYPGKSLKKVADNREYFWVYQEIIKL